MQAEQRPEDKLELDVRPMVDAAVAGYKAKGRGAASATGTNACLRRLDRAQRTYFCQA